ncbi:SGNH/GDSL hydrolase family protein [Bacteroidota bacterium]
MKEQGKEWKLAIVPLVAVMIINPIVLPLLEISSNDVSSASRIYIWSLDAFLLLIGLLFFQGLPAMLRKALSSLLMALLLVGSVEMASAIAFRVLFGSWSHHQHENLNKQLFEPHPYLVGSLRKGVVQHRDSLTYKHNLRGNRGSEVELEKGINKTRIVTVGGSTTYGVGVNNNETWPSYLSQELGDDYEVINLGVPGYTSVENLIQTALHFSDLDPDIAIYFIGLNDLRNVNMKNLAADYSDYHAPSLYSALGLCNNENVPSLATIKMGLIVCQRMGLLEACPNQRMKVSGSEQAGVDQRALDLFGRNLQNIVGMCKKQDVRPIFVPQVLLEEVLKTGDYSWWIPYVPTNELGDMMEIFNGRLREVADQDSILYVSAVSKHNWQKEDFVDLSHFTRQANAKLANIVADAVLEVRQNNASRRTSSN